MIDWAKTHSHVVALVAICLIGIIISVMVLGVDLMPYIEALRW